jgi:hypothetical protein
MAVFKYVWKRDIEHFLRSSMYALLSKCGNDDVEEVFYIVIDKIMNERIGRRS